MFFFILVLVAIGSSSFSVQCLEHSKFDLPEHLDNKNVLAEFKPFIKTYKPVDLSPGTPDLLPPLFLRDALANASSSLDSSVHQYMFYSGPSELRNEIARLYSPLIKRPLDTLQNIIVTVGATQALDLILFSHTAPGDEWIVLEPAYNTYYVNIRMARGTVRPVALKANVTRGKLSSGDLIFDKDELRRAFNARTKGIIVNNPHNPTGKAFTKEELLFIAKLAIKWDTMIISDEVYEWMMYDSTKHIRMASLGERIFNRTITVGSMSKTFFATGLRVGWAYGPSKLIGNLQSQHYFTVLSGNSHAQVAAAEVLRKMRSELGHPNSYFTYLVDFLEQRRNFLISVLDRIGMEVIVPQTGYYVYAKWTSLESRITDIELEKGNSQDFKFVKWLIKNAGVLTYPGTPMYLSEGKKIGENYIRLCFAKKTETLVTAARLLQKQFP